MEIKRLINPDSKTITKIAEIHQSVLIESFLNNFGLKFLEIIYKNLLLSPYTIFLVAYENEKITGFLLAVTDYSKFFKLATTKEKSKLVAITLKTLVLKPQITYKLISSLLQVSKEESHAELQFIAILPDYQGQNIGTRLVDELKKAFLSFGIKKYYVGTKANDQLSNKFYLKVGFDKVYTKTYFGEKHNYYLSSEF